jgi:hypothetical protein
LNSSPRCRRQKSCRRPEWRIAVKIPVSKARASRSDRSPSPVPFEMIIPQREISGARYDARHGSKTFGASKGASKRPTWNWSDHSVHRRLWDRDGFYRVALFFGPAPLVGAALAAIVWGCIVAVQTMTYQPPPWAHYAQATNWDNGSPDAPHPASPAKPLPPLRADGSAIGYDSGWNMTANPLTISPTMEADVGATPIIGFTIDEPTATMSRILDGDRRINCSSVFLPAF